MDHSSNIIASNAAVKMSKMIQVLSGMVYDNDGNEVEVEDGWSKLEALVDIIEQLPEEQGIVVFAEWKHVINKLKDKLGKDYKVATINGDTKMDVRAKINEDFLNNKIKVLILQPVTGAFGLDLSSTNIIVYYTPSYRAELVQQSYDRIRNFSSASKGFYKFTVYHLLCDRVEREVYSKIADKLINQEELFSLIRRNIMEESLEW